MHKAILLQAEIGAVWLEANDKNFWSKNVTTIGLGNILIRIVVRPKLKVSKSFVSEKIIFLVDCTERLNFGDKKYCVGNWFRPMKLGVQCLVQHL